MTAAPEPRPPRAQSAAAGRGRAGRGGREGREGISAKGETRPVGFGIAAPPASVPCGAAACTESCAASGLRCVPAAGPWLVQQGAAMKHYQANQIFGRNSLG